MTITIGLSIDPAMPRFLELVREAERLGVDSVWVPEFWADDALTPLAYLAADTDADAARHRHRAARGAHAGDARDVGAWRAGAVGRAVRPRHRHERTAGDGGLARRAVRPTRAAHPRDDRDHPHDHRRGAARYDGEVYKLPLPGGEGRASARDADRRRPDLRRVARPGQPAPHRRARRRVDRQLVLPRDRRRVLRPDPRGRGAAGRSLDDIDRHRRGRRRVHRRRGGIEAAGRRHADGYAFTFGAMGSATTNFYNDAFARQGYGDDVARGAAAVARRRPRGRPRHACRSRSDSAPTSSDRPTTIRDRLGRVRAQRGHHLARRRQRRLRREDRRPRDLDRPRRRCRRVARHDRLTAPDPPPTARRSTTIDAPAATTNTTTGSPTISAPRSPHEPGSTPVGVVALSADVEASYLMEGGKLLLEPGSSEQDDWKVRDA